MMARLLLAVALSTWACAKPTATRFTTGGDEIPAEAGHTYRWREPVATRASMTRRTGRPPTFSSGK
jgi:hypothetical protein